ncbi:uncharacterized protein LOC126355635 [Schistocerca gregaria]|uniref:uncharacterized protein LOC126355635 n=1 Tax=Schistocerca gregaria TaxID=7010 RepID=UPI00211DAF9D|nr:uncharacterized protein LOC126355635 [Schistocerca gregaria]
MRKCPATRRRPRPGSRPGGQVRPRQPHLPCRSLLAAGVSSATTGPEASASGRAAPEAAAAARLSRACDACGDAATRRRDATPTPTPGRAEPVRAGMGRGGRGGDRAVPSRRQSAAAAATPGACSGRAPLAPAARFQLQRPAGRTLQLQSIDAAPAPAPAGTAAGVAADAPAADAADADAESRDVAEPTSLQQGSRDARPQHRLPRRLSADMASAVDVCAVSAGLLVAGRVLGAAAVATAAAAANVSTSSSSPVNGSSTEPRAANSSAAFANIDDGGGIDPRDFAQGYTDVQTLMLAGVCTLIVLVFALGAGFAVRIAWRKLRERAADGYTGVVHRDDSSDPLQGGAGGGRVASASTHSSGNLLADELKAAAAHCSAHNAVLDGAAIDDVSSQSPLLAGSASAGSVRSHANGSVITMTLKNNHLIVETQDRAVRLQDGATKTTTTTFTTSASPEHEPVFVVEVTQPRGYSALPACADADADADAANPGACRQAAPAASQRAQVHRADADDDDEDAGGGASVEEASSGVAPASGAAPPRSNTGLSQSDLSVSSAGSANPSYRYGNQTGYDGGPFGYPQYAGYCVEAAASGAGAGAAGAVAAATTEAPSASAPATDTPGSARRPVFWGAQDSMLSSDQQSEQLLSDILQEELLQEEQRQLGNGSDSAAPGLHRTGSLPPRVRAEPTQEESGAQQPGSRLEPVAEAAAPRAAYSPRKRASLPAISAGLCRPSPRLEGFTNDISPLREVADQSPEAERCTGTRTLQDGVSEKPFENKSFVSTDQMAS